MKKFIYAVIAVLVVAVSFSSCDKDWHCTCSYNNKVMLTKDLQTKTKGQAEDECNTYDTTVIGQYWNCTVY